MKDVNIYILTSYKSPKMADGACAYVMMTKDRDGHEITVDKFYRVRKHTKNRAELATLWMALLRMRVKSHLTIYTDSQYIKSGIESWLSGWRDCGWVNAKGQEVTNAHEWKAIDALLKDHEVSVVLGEKHPFYSWMTEGIEKCLKNLESSTAARK